MAQVLIYQVRKKLVIQNCSSQEDTQIHFRELFDRTRSFRFNCKKRYQKWKILFCTKSMQNTKKTSTDLQLNSWLFLHKSYIFSFIHPNRFYENQKLNFPAKIYKIRKNVRKQNCLFQKDLQLWFSTFFHRSNIFCLLNSVNCMYHKEHRTPCAKRDIHMFRSEKHYSRNACPRRAQIFIFDENTNLMDIK